MPKDHGRAHRVSRRDRVPLGLGALSVSVGDHIGHFYQTKEECEDLLVAFLVAGIEAGEKCIYHVSTRTETGHLRQALVEAGVDVERAEVGGQLVLREGKSDPEEMKRLLAAAFSEVPSCWPLIRWGGDATWGLEKMPTSEAFMSWDTHLNTVEDPPAVFLCQFDLTAFSGRVVMDALKAHPLCIVGNAPQTNPYYMEPEAFLEELRRRDPTPSAW